MITVNAMHGVQMYPDEIETLIVAMRQAQVAHELREEHDNGDD